MLYNKKWRCTINDTPPIFILIFIPPLEEKHRHNPQQRAYPSALIGIHRLYSDEHSTYYLSVHIQEYTMDENWDSPLY